METLQNFVQIFRSDSRPTFLIDASEVDTKNLVRYCNPACRKILEAGIGTARACDDLLETIRRFINPCIPIEATYCSILGLRWKGITLHEGLLLIQLAEGQDIFQPTKESSIVTKKLPRNRHGKEILEPRSSSKATVSQLMHFPADNTPNMDALTLDDLIDPFPMGYAEFRFDGSFVAANEAYIRLIGSTNIDFQHGVLGETAVTGGKDLLKKQLAAFAARKRTEPFDIQVKRPWLDHTPHTSLSVTCGFRVGAGNKATGLVVCVTDITDRKSWKDKDDHSSTEAYTSDSQTDMSKDLVLHELKNPLSAILQSADSILSSVRHEPDPNKMHEEIDDAASTIKLCAEHQARIMADALTLARLESQKLELHFDKEKPTDLLKKATKFFKAEAEAADVKLCTRVQRVPGCLDIANASVLVDSGRMLQILINLVANAIKFTRNCTERSITISLDVSDSRPQGTHKYLPRIHQSQYRKPAAKMGKPVYLQFCVSDTGPGLKSEETAKLFNRFAQASSHVSSKHGGYGLGLYTSRCLAELLNGQICVSSEPGQGSTFAFYVEGYLQKQDLHQHLQASTDPESDIRSPAQNSEVTLFSPGCTVHCLVVDDNRTVRNVLTKRLLKLGILVSVADNGADALVLIESAIHQRDTTPISVVFMDLHMPVMDGFVCAERIRSMEQAGQLEGRMSVIGISGSNLKDQLAYAIKQGMDAVIQKPFPISSVLKYLTK